MYGNDECDCNEPAKGSEDEECLCIETGSCECTEDYCGCTQCEGMEWNDYDN